MHAQEQAPGSFGDWLRRQRRALDLTQEELALQVGCSAITLRKLEAEQRRPSKQIAERLAEVLHIPPDDRPAFLRFARGDPFAAPDFSAVASDAERERDPHVPRHNLPTQLTPLIGRNQIAAAITERLRPADAGRARLLTLTGAGGTGKTRLAIQVATELLGEFADGVFFVNLAPLPNPALVALTIAQTLGVSLLGEQLPLERLQDHLRDKQLLLVLDNFEHLLDAAPQLAALLAAAPGLTLLVTSRVVLHLSGEQEWPVPPLPVPDLRQLPGVEALSQVAAVTLFIQRARAAQPDFQMTELTAPAMAEICVRLDGLPLAIELAAARSKVLQPGALLTRLSSRLGLLTGGARDLPARQQTLRSTIDWSYHLLAAEEQVLFARLAVFAGGWTVEAAVQVCNSAGDLPFDMLDGLQALLDHSLLRKEVWHEGTPRFSMLETIGEYALERLEASGEAEAGMRRHAAYFLAVAEAGMPTGFNRLQPARLDRIAAERANLRAAMTWAQSGAGGAELGERLAAAMLFSSGFPGRGAAGPSLLTPTSFASLSAGPLSQVPRNRTVVVAASFSPPGGVTNPLNRLGYTIQEGNNLLWEGLAYYGIFADKEIPWLAESLVYTRPDFTELTIKLNPLARWSDGQPVTAQDVIFTFQAQLDNDNLRHHPDFQKFVRAFKTLDDQTLVLTFKLPAPRFKFEVLTMKFDSGIEIVPAHALGQQADVNTFAGGLDLRHSGPYNLVESNADRKVYDLRPDWWAVRARLIPEPAVRRVTLLNVGNVSWDMLAHRMANNDFDTSRDVSNTLIAEVLRQNPKVTTYAGRAPPYGYLDWWPLSLWVNTQLAPYDDARVRRALSLAIDRRKIDQIVFAGAGFATVYPFPLYPGLKRFVDSPDVKALEAKYRPGKSDLAESARLMTEAGFKKNSGGFWARDGQVLDATVYGIITSQVDVAPILVEMFRQAGFISSADFGRDGFDRAAQGSPGLYLWGHAASVTDPYAALELYHSHRSTPSLSMRWGGINSSSRYKNSAYDQIVDAMAVLAPDDPRFYALAVQALEIYWRDVIDIPVTQSLHIIPYNQTYWTNWPTLDNPAMGTSGAFWHNTGTLVITSLKPAQQPVP